MKIIRKNSAGIIVDVIEVSNIDIVEDAIVIKQPKFEEEIVKRVKIIEEDKIVINPILQDKIIDVEKVNIIEKNRVVEVPNFIKKDIIVKNFILDTERKTITIYEFEYVKKKIPVLEEYIVKVPKLVYVDTEVPKIIEVDTKVPKLIVNDVVVTNAIVTDVPVNTCVINHTCPHCGKVSVGFTDKEVKG